MNYLSRDLPFGSPFISSGAPSLADVLVRLEQVKDLKATRRRDLRSAVKSIGTLLDRRLEEIPANINWLHVRLRRVNPAAHKKSKKRFANIKSDALRALELTGCSRSRSDWLRRPTPTWKTLLDQISDKHDLWKLSQFAQYCSALEIVPRKITDTDVRGFLNTLIEESFVNRPEHVAVYVVKTWNRLRGEIPDWPKIELSELPRKRVPWTIPLERFPQSFQDDVDRWLDRLANPDLLDGSGPMRPLRPKTIKHRRFQIREMASALVKSGIAKEEVNSLGVLVEFTNFKSALRLMMSRFEDKPTEAIHGLAVGIKAIAQHHVKVSDDQLTELKELCGRLNLEVDGLREKNRVRLLQLDDPNNLANLLQLPEVLVAKARKPKVKARKAALMVQAALAIEILLYAPMRIGNLASVNLERHVRSIRIKRDICTQIHIPGDEVKNSKALAYELGSDTTKLLEHYLAEARPVLLRDASDYLFPAQNGGPKSPTGLSRLVNDTIRDEIGLDINAHLFRSIAVKLHSLAAPGDIVTLSHVLNDTLRTTTRAYAQFEQKSALEHYQRSVDTARRKARGGK